MIQAAFLANNNTQQVHMTQFMQTSCSVAVIKVMMLVIPLLISTRSVCRRLNYKA